MLNLALASVAAMGASLVTFSTDASGLVAPVRHSECGSLVIFGLSLLALSFVAKRVATRS
jgi:hypothetical protein